MESIPTAAIPTPYTPVIPMLAAIEVDINIMTARIDTGITTDYIPTDKPEIITVADPVSPEAAISLTGDPPV